VAHRGGAAEQVPLGKFKTEFKAGCRFFLSFHSLSEWPDTKFANDVNQRANELAPLV
jgi:hypothetical protein